MHRTAGIAIIVAGSGLALLTAGWLRTRLPRPAIDVLMALSGAVIGIGGLLMIEDVGTASWFVGPVILAIVAPLHVRALFAGEGPFRT